MSCTTCGPKFYCPSDAGAGCHSSCPLGPGGELRAAMRQGIGASDRGAFSPVPGQVHDLLAQRTTSVRVAAVLSLPGTDDERRGFPLAGRGGLPWQEALRDAAHSRVDVDLFYLGSCRPPGPESGAWQRMEKGLALLREETAAALQRKAPGTKAGVAKQLAEQVHPHPVACCKPRLLRDLEPYDCILALGAEAYCELTGEDAAIGKVAGTGKEVELPLLDGSGTRTVKVFAMQAPNYVLHKPSARSDYAVLLAKAFRFFEGTLRWVEPTWRVNPTGAELREWWAWARGSVRFVSVDSETDNIEPSKAWLDSIQIATPDLGPDGKPTQDQYLAEREGVLSEVVVLLTARGMRKRRDAGAEAEIFGQPIRTPTAADLRVYFEVAREIMLDAGIMKTGSNLGYYDTLVFENGPDNLMQGGKVDCVGDLLFASRFRAPDMPKGLKPNGVVFLDLARWDTTESGEQALRSPWLHVNVRYAGYDAAAGVRISAPLFNAAAARGAFDPLPEALKPAQWPSPGQPQDTPWNLWELDHERQRMCRRLHLRGLPVHQPERLELQSRFEASVAQRKARLAKLIGSVRGGVDVDLDSWGTDAEDPDVIPDASYNAGSADQLRTLLYEELGLEPPVELSDEEIYTETGQLSTGSHVLRAFMAQGGLDPRVLEIIVQTRLLRRERGKVLGTFLWPLDPWNKNRSSCLYDDGRVHGAWSAHTTEPGRLSCGGFPLQIIGARKGLDVLKRLFKVQQGAPARGLVWQCHDSLVVEVTMPDGRVAFLGADLDQAHLRIMANHWKIPKLQECFQKGWCPYSVLADVLFGDQYRKADGWGPEGYRYGRKPPKVKGGSAALAMRETAKAVRLALAYKVAVPTATATIMATEYAEFGPDGKPTGGTLLPFLRLELPDLGYTGQDVVAHWQDLWLESEPEWEGAWAGAERRYAQNGGYLAEPVLLRRSGGLDDGKPTKVVNTEILAAEASVMALAEREVERVFDEEIGEGWARRPTEEKVLCGMMEEVMRVRVPGWDFPFTAEAKVGESLADV